MGEFRSGGGGVLGERLGRGEEVAKPNERKESGRIVMVMNPRGEKEEK